MFVQPLKDKVLSFHHKIPLSSGFFYHSILVLAYDCSGSQTILQRLRKVYVTFQAQVFVSLFWPVNQFDN